MDPQNDATSSRHRITPATLADAVSNEGVKQMLSEIERTQPALAKELGSAGRNKGATAGQWYYAASFIFVNHLIAIWTLIFKRNVSWAIIIATFLMAWSNLTGVTVCYHRMYSHRSFKAVLPVRAVLMIMGTMSFQGSAKYWVLAHRLHHRFTDTDLDPYDSTKGFWFSHIGWLFHEIPTMNKVNLISTSDLDTDVVLSFQKKYILYLYLLFGGAFPMWIGWMIAADPWAGLLWIGMVGRVISWHCIFSVNSFAHWKGSREYDHTQTAVKTPVIHFFMNGEGNHSFHHAFPQSYAHGFHWSDWDPSKWIIAILEVTGLVYDVKRVDPNEVNKAIVTTLEHSVLELKKGIAYPPQDWELKVMKMDDVKRAIEEEGRLLIILSGFVVDVTSFIDIHPGGRAYLHAFRGKDVTAAFYGEVTVHTNAAANLSAMMRIARFEK